MSTMEITKDTSTCLSVQGNIEQMIESLLQKLKLNRTQDAILECEKIVAVDPSAITKNYDITIEKIIECANLLRCKSKYTSSISLICWLSELSQIFGTGNFRLKNLDKFCQSAFQIANNLWLKNMKAVIEYKIIPLLQTLVANIQNTEKANDQLKVITQTWSAYYLGMCYKFCGNNSQYLTISQAAILDMQTFYGPEAEKFHVVELCHRLTATTNSYMW